MFSHRPKSFNDFPALSHGLLRVSSQIGLKRANQPTYRPRISPVISKKTALRWRGGPASPRAWPRNLRRGARPSRPILAPSCALSPHASSDRLPVPMISPISSKAYDQGHDPAKAREPKFSARFVDRAAQEVIAMKLSVVAVAAMFALSSPVFAQSSTDGLNGSTLASRCVALITAYPIPTPTRPREPVLRLAAVAGSTMAQAHRHHWHHKHYRHHRHSGM